MCFNCRRNSNEDPAVSFDFPDKSEIDQILCLRYNDQCEFISVAVLVVRLEGVAVGSKCRAVRKITVMVSVKVRMLSMTL